MNRLNIRTLTGPEIRRVSCPVCKAPPGSPCTEPATGARRDAHHKERVALARRAASQQRPSAGLDAVRRRVAERMFRP